jgi:hypothetical protein
MMLILSGVQNTTNNSKASSKDNYAAGTFSQNTNSFGNKIPSSTPGTGYNPYDGFAAYSSDNYSGDIRY